MSHSLRKLVGNNKFGAVNPATTSDTAHDTTLNTNDLEINAAQQSSRHHSSHHSFSADGRAGLSDTAAVCLGPSSPSSAGMMNHPHMPAGPGQHHNIAPALPLHPHSRRQQEYHTYHHPSAQQPQSPIHPYANYPHPGYYSHAAPPLPPQYNPPRWQQHPYPAPQYVPAPPPPQPPYQPRSPMVVTSQPHAQTMTPVTRQTPIPPPLQQQPSQSPRPIPHYVHHQVHTPVAPPSPAPTPKNEQEQPSVPQEQSPLPQPPSRRQSLAVNPLSLPPEHKMPFYPDLPWLSFKPEKHGPFPSRGGRRRRRRQDLHDIDSVALPNREDAEVSKRGDADDDVQAQAAEEVQSEASTVAVRSEAETPATSQAPSESDFTVVPASATPEKTAISPSRSTPPQPQHGRRDTRTAIAVPNIPGFSRPKASPPAVDKAAPATPTSQPDATAPLSEAQKPSPADVQQAPDEGFAAVTPPPKPAFTSWADLVRKNIPAGSAAGLPNGSTVTNSAKLPKSASLADALKQYSVQTDGALSFLEPRGLVNTGNMCYMNSVSDQLHPQRLVYLN